MQEPSTVDSTIVPSLSSYSTHLAKAEFLAFSVPSFASISFTLALSFCDRSISRELSNLARRDGEDYCGETQNNADVEKDEKREK